MTPNWLDSTIRYVIALLFGAILGAALSSARGGFDVPSLGVVASILAAGATTAAVLVALVPIYRSAAQKRAAANLMRARLVPRLFTVLGALAHAYYDNGRNRAEDPESCPLDEKEIAAGREGVERLLERADLLSEEEAHRMEDLLVWLDRPVPTHPDAIISSIYERQRHEVLFTRARGLLELVTREHGGLSGEAIQATLKAEVNRMISDFQAIESGDKPVTPNRDPWKNR